MHDICHRMFSPHTDYEKKKNCSARETVTEHLYLPVYMPVSLSVYFHITKIGGKTYFLLSR